MTMADELRAQGFKEGFERGFKEGFERGMRLSIEILLTQRFGPLPEALTSRIQTADSANLDRWLERVLTAESAESVLEGELLERGIGQLRRTLYS